MSNFSVNNPSTGQTEDTFTRIDDSRRDEILDRSTAAYRAWRTTTVDERAAVLRRTADLYEERTDELTSHIGREMGKLRKWAKAELGIVVDIYRYYAEHAHELLADRELPAQGAQHTYVRKDPIGPLLGIMPWNFPYYQVARWAAPNLLLGNSLVLKHASICPLSSQACQDLLEEAGLPQDVFQNIYATGSQMDAFVADPRIVGVSLTGSERAGAAVAKTAGENYKKSLLELGGNDPFIVLDDDNLDTVLDKYVGIRMYNTGQACNAPKRLIVMESFYDRVVEGLEKRISALTPGAWDDTDADVGPCPPSTPETGLSNGSPRRRPTATPPCVSAAAASTVPARSWNPRCSPTSTRRPTWAATRSSARWPSSTRRRTSTMPWRSPTVPSTASPGPCGAPTSPSPRRRRPASRSACPSSTRPRSPPPACPSVVWDAPGTGVSSPSGASASSSTTTW